MQRSPGLNPDLGVSMMPLVANDFRRAHEDRMIKIMVTNGTARSVFEDLQLTLNVKVLNIRKKKKASSVGINDEA